MAKFNVVLHVEAWQHVEIEASSPEDARDQAIATMELEPQDTSVSEVSVEDEDGNIHLFNGD